MCGGERRGAGGRSLGTGGRREARWIGGLLLCLFAGSAPAGAAVVPLLPPHGLRAADVPAVVARVNGRAVATWLYLSQVNFALALRETSAGPGQPGTVLPPQQVLSIERHALLAVIENALLVAYGEAHHLAPTPAQAADTYERVVQRRGGPTASRRQVAQEYLTADQDRVVSRNAIVAQHVLDHFIAGLGQPVVAVEYRMIVSAAPAPANRVRDLLRATGRWVSLAARFSRDAVGREAGGEQPLYRLDTQDAQSADAALRPLLSRLPVGQISKPVRLRQGWAVVEVMRHFPAPEQFQADVQLYRAWVERLRRHARITSYISLDTP